MIERKADVIAAYKRDRPDDGNFPNRGNLDQARRAPINLTSPAPVHGSICYRHGRRIGVYGVNIPLIDSLNRNPEP
jgi:hypothetical protein